MQNSRWQVNEDWLAVIVAFILIVLALVGVIHPGWLVF